MDFGGIRSGGQSPHWYSPKSENHSVPMADLQLCLDICSQQPPNTTLLSIAWLAEIFSSKHRIVVCRAADGAWFVPLKHEAGSAALVWPVRCESLRPQADTDVFELMECDAPMVLTVGGLDG